MRFKLVESNNKIKYDGWSQEDIELYESIDWDQLGDEDYDAGFAYLDSAVLYKENDVDRIETEFHKFFKRDPYSKPYYMPIETRPFETTSNYIGPVGQGKLHKDYEVLNQYDSIKK